MYYNNKKIGALFYNNKEIKKAYFEGREVFSKISVPDCIAIYSESGGSVGLTIPSALNLTGVIQYSYDGNTWSNATSSFLSGTVIYLRGYRNQSLGGYDGNFRWAIHCNTNDVHIDGDIEDLRDLSRTVAPVSYTYANMFVGNSTLKSAPTLSLKNLTNYCYYQMFAGCNNLTHIPSLGASTLAPSCYEGMFKNCVSINTIPAVYGSGDGSRAFVSMFEGCSLIQVTSISVHAQYTYKVPNVQGTTPYYHMFYNTFNSVETPVGGTTYYTNNRVLDDRIPI